MHEQLKVEDFGRVNEWREYVRQETVESRGPGQQNESLRPQTRALRIL